MSILTYYEMAIHDLLGWSRADTQRWFELIRFAEMIGIPPRELGAEVEEIVNEFPEQERLDLNTWLYATMEVIFQNLISELPESLREKAIDKWNPITNYMDTWFNIECLDDIVWDSFSYDPENWYGIRERAVRCLKKWVGD